MNKLDGENILYHYLQKDLLTKDVWLFQMLAARLVASLGIWFHPDLYRQIPILLPFARRDSTCRKNCNKEHIEQWGSPDKEGYFRDDNSLIKSIPKGLAIRSPLKDIYGDKKIGTGFVACHVWRILERNKKEGVVTLTTQNPLVYSFIPNLVWLPKQVAKLTDREGSFAQLYLQAVSYKIFRNIKISEKLKNIIDKSWKKLIRPIGIPEQGLPEIEELNFFEHNDPFIVRRKKIINNVLEGINAISEGRPPQNKIISSRYSIGLKNIHMRKICLLKNFILKYSNAIHKDHKY